MYALQTNGLHYIHFPRRHLLGSLNKMCSKIKRDQMIGGPMSVLVIVL